MDAAQTSIGEPLLRASDDFFAELGTDTTFTNSYTLTFSPTSVVQDHRVTYEIPKMAAGSCIFLGDLLLSMMVKLVDKSGNAPADGSLVRQTKGKEKVIIFFLISIFY